MRNVRRLLVLRRFLPALLVLCAPVFLAQTPVEHPKFRSSPAVGYYWQGLGTYEVRWRILYFTRQVPHENVSLETSAAFFSVNGLYVAPQAGLKYYRPIFLSRLQGRLAFSPRVNYCFFFRG